MNCKPYKEFQMIKNLQIKIKTKELKTSEKI